MKKNDIKQLKQRPLAELEKALREHEERLRVLKFDLAAGKVKDIAELRTVRRDIARLKTFITLQSHGNTE